VRLNKAGYLRVTNNHYLQLLLEIEVLLGGGQRLQHGLPTVLQSVMHAFEVDAISLNFWDDAPLIDLAFPTYFGSTALLMPSNAPLLKAFRSTRTPTQVSVQDFQTVILAPVKGIDEFYGCLQMVTAQERGWSNEEQLTLQMIGRQIGIAVENAVRYSTMQQHSAELSLLIRVGDNLLRLLSSLQIDKVAERIMDAVRILLDVEETSIFIQDIESGDLILWRYTPAEKDLSIRLKTGQGIAGWVLANGKSAIVNDVHQDPRWEPHFDATTEFTTRSLLAIPITLDGTIIGVVEAINKLKDDFTESDESLLQTLARWSAIAIGNANTYNELKHTHERLLDTHKQAAMAQMVLNLTHKINNSVGAIRVWALDALTIGSTDPESRGLLENMLTNAEETLMLLRRIRGATELQTSTLVPVNVEHALETAVQAAHLPSGVMIHRHYDSDLPPVGADPERLVEVFLNLIDNAGDVLSANGQINLMLRRTHHGAIEAIVQDNGNGIPDHLGSTVFDPFVTSKSNGLGLGLWMVKLYVEMIGGSVSMSSTSGKGSTFRITLPAYVLED
jgi:signal transduction histidine kinase